LLLRKEYGFVVQRELAGSGYREDDHGTIGRKTYFTRPLGCAPGWESCDMAAGPKSS
jgi:hypothetical protein